MQSERFDIDAMESRDTEAPGTEMGSDDAVWLRRARSLYQESTDYYQSSLFKSWRDNIAHFRSEHAPGSKYTKDAYRNRSHVFRPKPRASVRALEATAATALFTNDNLLSVRGINPDDPMQAEAGKLHQAMLQHRLEVTIPWFLTVIGAYQDTHVYGICISRQYWDRRTKTRTEIVPVMDEVSGEPLVDEDGMLLGEEVANEEVLSDEPAIELIAPDNFRFDPACDWRQPVKTSPYLIETIPMYAGDVLAMMESGNWNEHSLGELVAHGADDEGGETVRDAREGKGREDATDVHQANEYSVVWVHFNIIRDASGEDWAFYTVGTGLLLTDPMPLEDVDPLGRERYCVGFSSIEAHRTHPSSTIEMNRPLTEMLNDVTNQRLDNVKLVLNKRYAIRRGSNIDLGALMRNVPGGGVMMDDVQRDYAIMPTPDVTQSSYVEQDRLAVESDELLGTFSQSSVQSNRSLNETVGGMNLMSSSANQVQELGLRTFIETWVEPVLRTMVKLEGLYETDETILALAAGKAEIEHEISDEMLMQDLVVKVNVGMGNTNPEQKIARFLQPLQAAAKFPELLKDIDSEEVGKEIFALAGQGDGERFMLTEEKRKERADSQEMPPELQIKMKELQLREQELQLKTQQWQHEAQLEQQNQQWEQQYKAAELQTRQERDRQELALKQGLTMAQLEQKLELESRKLELDMQKTSAQLQNQRDLEAAKLTDSQNERQARRTNQSMGFDSY
ncbi:MAG: portal protein [Pseudomonadota bacterium]